MYVKRLYLRLGNAHAGQEKECGYSKDGAGEPREGAGKAKAQQTAQRHDDGAPGDGQALERGAVFPGLLLALLLGNVEVK